MDLEFAGEKWQLYSPGGLYWPRQQALLIADLHLGREASLRRASIPVPRGSTSATLERLDRLLRVTDAQQLWILGDLFHAACSLASDVVAEFEQFMQRHALRQWLLVRGNHDRRVRQFPRDWPLQIVDPPHAVGELALCHEPTEGESFSIAAHLHPSVRLRLAGEEGRRIACLWRRGRTLILPALGDFTGTATIRPTRDDSVWLLLDDEVLLAPPEHLLTQRMF